MPTKEATETILMVKDVIIKFFVEYGFKLFGGMVILIIGILVARWIGKLVLRQLSKKDMEPPVRMLIVRMIKLVIIAFTLVLVLEKVGVAIAPLVAGIGVAGIGIGLAMQGVLGNVVAGLTIIFTKPFRVGEYIELLSMNGRVTTIELFSTTLVHSDRSRIVIPNRKIVGEILRNYGTIRQLNLSVGVAYGTNVTEAIAMVNDVLASNPRVLKNMEPAVGTSALGDSGVSISIQPWVSVPDYGSAAAEINLAVLERFRAARIEIPFPQREVRLVNIAAA
ncbi:MAG: mechanosensitive ion channel [Pedosphaera sp.]|nr:mechanosensitive ion channel [Pedosphaera sp.]